jgi:hypothetical protein
MEAALVSFNDSAFVNRADGLSKLFFKFDKLGVMGSTAESLFLQNSIRRRPRYRRQAPLDHPKQTRKISEAARHPLAIGPRPGEQVRRHQERARSL